MPSNSTSLYTSVSTGSVSSNNFTTLYSSPATINAAKAYGNSNVEAFLNAGTDGANTVQNINMAGSLTVGGISDLGPVGNVIIEGGTSGYVLSTDGAGNLSWVAGSTGGGLAGSNTQVQYNNAGSFGASANFTFTNTSNTLTVDKIVANGSQLSSITGANVTGTVANAAHATVANSANSVAVANVVGIGNIATVNLDGNVSNVLSGTGTWIPIGTALNANYANYAGNVTIAAQPNITSLGTLTSLTVTGLTTATGGVKTANIQDTTGTNTITTGYLYTGDVGITGNLTLGTGGSGNLTTDSVQYKTSPGTLAVATGQMAWNAAEQTLNLGMNNGVTQQVGLESYILIKASSAITNGQVVMFTGANGNNVTAAPADVTITGFRAGYILGVATQDIALNATGYITSFGQVHQLNTNAYNVGDLLWLNPAVAGGMTATQPSAPNYQIQIATVTKKSGGDGHIQVIIRPEPQLKDISDVTITTPTTGQALIYNGSNVWINGNPAQANTANTANVANVANYVVVTNSNSTASTQYISYVSGTGNNQILIDTDTSALQYIPSTNTLIVGNVTMSGGTLLMGSTGIVRTNRVQTSSSLTWANANASTGIVEFTYGATIGFVTGSANLDVQGNINLTFGKAYLGSNSNVVITGGTTGQSLTTDGLGNLSWTTVSAGTPGGSNTQLQFNDGGSFGGNSQLTYNKVTNLLSLTGTANIANITLNKYNELLPASANTSTSITPDLSTGSIFRYTANASFTFNSMANAVAGSSATVVVTQGGSGSYTLTSTMKFAGGSKTLSTAVGAIDIISVFYDGTTYYATLSKGYA